MDYDAQAREDIAKLQQAHHELESELHGLRKQVVKQAHQYEELTTTIKILSQLLCDTGDVDPKVLQYRIEAAIEELREEQRKPRCILCHEAREPNQFIITAKGLVCDPNCAATRSRA